MVVLSDFSETKFFSRFSDIVDKSVWIYILDEKWKQL